VALLRFPKAEQLSEHASRLTPRVRPSDVLARWDERTLALARSGEDARALMAFLQTPPGTAEALVGVADNRAHSGMGAQALITAAELNIGRGMEPATGAGAKPGMPGISRPEATNPPAVRPPPTATTPPVGRPAVPTTAPTTATAGPRTLAPIPTPGPLPARPTPGTRPADAGAAGQNRSQRILVADDEPALRRVLQRLLEQEGYVVETVEDGEEALARLLNPNLTPVDLLLLDVHMPRRSGIDVLRALREASSPVRALVLSARIRDADVLKLYGEGAADFVAKPFSIHTLLARVTRLLPPRTP
jgi:CheY-like chemotaxis protein